MLGLARNGFAPPSAPLRRARLRRRLGLPQGTDSTPGGPGAPATRTPRRGAKPLLAALEDVIVPASRGLPPVLAVGRMTLTQPHTLL